MNIPSRVKTIAEFVKYKTVCDVGCDHGYLLVYLARKGALESGAACDVKPLPLSGARGNINLAGFSGLIETRLSDGLSNVAAGEFESCVIAGIGGLLTVKILAADIVKTKSFKQIVLSPQKDIYAVRNFLVANNVKINGELIFYDAGKRYNVIDCGGESGESYSEAELTFGKRFIERRDVELHKFLETETAKFALVPKESAAGRYRDMCGGVLGQW